MISDQNLDGYTRSSTLPDPRHYTFYDRNPIFDVLADQAKQDEDFPIKISGKKIFKGIISRLQDKRIEWPHDEKLLPMEDWLRKIKTNLSFYHPFSKNPEEFQAFDRQLVQICANYLKRPINLIPFPEGEPQIFHPKPKTISAKPLNILSCNTAFRDSFAVSIFKSFSK